MSALIVCTCPCGYCTGQVTGGHEMCPYNCGRRTVAWLGSAATEAAEATNLEAYLRSRRSAPGAAVLPAVPPPCDGRNVPAAPGTGSSVLADGAGLPAAEPGDGELAHHTAGEPRPDRAGRGLTIDRVVGLPLQALRRIRRWS